jgi:hypothetical protein
MPYVYADNCGSLYDCYVTVETSLIVLASIVVAALIIFVAVDLSATDSAATVEVTTPPPPGSSGSPFVKPPADEQQPLEKSNLATKKTDGLLTAPGKKVKDSDTDTGRRLPIIELRIGCGLENLEVIERETSKKDNEIIGELTELEQKFSYVMNKVLETREKLKIIQRDAEFIEWCQEAEEDPDKVLSKISEDVIGKFLSSIEPYFQNLMLNQISVESDISVTKDSPKRIRKNITFHLKPIQAYIELAVYSDGERVSSAKLIFSVNSYVKIKNLTVYLEGINRYQYKQKKQQEQQHRRAPYPDQKVSNNNSNALRRRIRVENLLIGIRVQLTKMKIDNVEKTIEPSIEIGKKEAEIKDILFWSS